MTSLYPNRPQGAVSHRGIMCRHEKAPVHYRRGGDPAVAGTGTPLCHNGSWHLFWTMNHARVTCPVCLEILRGKASR